MDSLTTLNTYAATSVPYTDEAAGAATLANRYQINGVIDTNQSVMENLERICSAAGSWLSYDVAAGQWGVVINRSGASISSFDNSNIIGSISVSGSGLKDLYNAVRVEFPNRDVRDASDFVKIELPAGEKNANELPNTLNLAYDIINEPVQAQLLGFIELKQSRVDLLITFETDYSKISLKAGDLIDVTNSQFGFSAKVFRIISIAEKQGDGPITLEITALEYDAGVYTTADLTRFVRSDSTGIITIGSIGTPGTPSITKFEVDSRPRIVITSTAPTGIVEAMEFWRTTDTALSETARSYNLIGTQRPIGGGVYSSGQSVTLEFDTLNASNFLIKTRGVNEFTVGNFSAVSGLIEYVPQQITDGIDENTKIYDALTQAATGFAINFALKKLDELLGGTAGSLWERIAEILRNFGIPVPVTPPAAGATPPVSGPIAVSKSGTSLTTALTSLNFTGAGVNATNVGGAVTVTVSGGAGGLNILNTPEANDYLVYNGVGYVAVPTCCPTSFPPGLEPGYVAPAPQCFLGITTRLPPDRATGADPLTPNLTSDQVPTTGSFFIKFSPGTGQTFHGPLTVGSGNAKLYKSNGTLVETLAAGALIINKNVVEFPFATRTAKTDFYILLDQGLVNYCECTSPAVTATTGEGAWNFNTPLRSKTPYTLAADNFTTPNPTIPTLSTYAPVGNGVCKNATLVLNWSVSVLKNTGNIRIKKSSDDSTAQTIDASTATGSGTTLSYGLLSGLEDNTQYYIDADAGIVKSNDKDCAQQGLNAAIVKANGKTFTTFPELAVSGFIVDSDPPFASDPTYQKVNPQSNIGIVFNRAITLHSSGTITLNSSAGVHQVFNVADTFDSGKVSELITVSGSTLTIRPTVDMTNGLTHHVLLSAGCVKDACETVFAGLSDVNTIRFTVDPGPTAPAPVFSSNSPNESGVVLNFDRTVEPGTGNIQVFDSSNNLIASVPATDPSVTITEV